MHISNLQCDIDSNAVSYLNVIAEKAENITIKVLNNNGGFVKSLTTLVSAGAHKLSINISDLTSGNYILNAFTGDTFVKSIRFVKD